MQKNVQKICPISDAGNIDKAIQGVKKDDKQFFEIIGRRSKKQLRELKEEYNKKNECGLSKKIEQELDKDVVKLVKALLKDYTSYKGDIIYKAVTENHKPEEPLINFVIADTCEHIEKTKQYIQKEYNTSLVDLIQKCAKGPFKELMVRLAENKRCKGICEENIQKELEILKSQKEGKWTKDEVLSIFAQRSPEHLQKLSQRMKECCNVTLGEMIVNETEGCFQDALLACSFPLEVFWANRIHTALKNYKNDDCLLICCFSQCSKTFLQMVAKEYVDTFKVNVVDDVKKYTSGNLCILLLTLLDLPESELNQLKSK